jgi:catechol 2,3-dioxygenase-like lactoylglutathione lyase family enzyme
MLPTGHAKRLFLGFSCSTAFLVVFALLIAYNTEAESSTQAGPSVDDNYPLTIGIPTADPEVTINFYQKLGFRISDSIAKGLDVVCMEKEGTPYKLEICHNRLSEAGPLSGGVSGMSFRVKDLDYSVRELRGKGLCFMETGSRDGVYCASLKDPNGININLFEP